MKKIKTKDTVIYQAKNGGIELRTDTKRETVWITQREMANVFDVDARTVSEHLNNIYKTRELDANSTIRKFRLVAGNGKVYNILHYNLDAIISVGYRVNSKTATEFRKWATKTLKDHITKGYTINKKQIQKNYDSFMKSVADIQDLLPENIILDPKTILDLVKEFSSTWLSLDSYDKGKITHSGGTKKVSNITILELVDAISKFRTELVKKKELNADYLYEKEKGSMTGLIGNIMQTFDGRPLYETIEEKASHLLYFFAKDHLFVDGNKRSAAFAFIYFLRQSRARSVRHINQIALTALTLLAAESDPAKKDLIVGLIAQILK